MDKLQVATWRIPQSDSDQLEAIALLGQDRPKLETLREHLHQEGLFYLATCQRVIIAAPGFMDNQLTTHDLLVGLANTLGWEGLPVNEPEMFVGEAAFSHLGEVSSSLDSLVPGEPQVLGQFKEAFKQCQREGLLCSDLERLLSRVLKVAKRVRSQTRLFKGSVSLMPLTTRFLSQAVKQAELGCCQVAVVGTGPIGLALLSKLAPHKNLNLYCVSHSLKRAQEVADKVPNHTFAVSLEEFLADPPCLDAIALATTGHEAFLTTEQVTKIMGRRCPGHPGDGGIRVLDLAMPRNAQRDIKDIPGCELVQIDDLVEISQQSKEARREALNEAQEILEQELANLRRERWKTVHQERILQLRGSLEQAAKERLATFPGDFESDPKLKRWMEQTLNGLIHVAQERLMHALEMVEAIYPSFHPELAKGQPLKELPPGMPENMPPAMAEALEKMGIEVPGAKPAQSSRPSRDETQPSGEKPENSPVNIDRASSKVSHGPPADMMKGAGMAGMPGLPDKMPPAMAEALAKMAEKGGQVPGMPPHMGAPHGPTAQKDRSTGPPSELDSTGRPEKVSAKQNERPPRHKGRPHHSSEGEGP